MKNNTRATLYSPVALLVSLATLLSTSIFADPPPGYYDSANGLSGSQLRAALHDIINDHTVIPYSSTATDTSDALKVLDEDSANTNNVWLLYAQRTQSKSSFGQTTGWNREHMWCNSYGLDDVQPAFSDLHNLRAEDANVNSARGNKFYDISNASDPGYQSPAHAEAPLCSTDSDSWEPPTNVRGDIARALFYMDVRYEGDRANEQNLILTTNVIEISAATNLMGHLTILLQWHQDDPVDAAEMARNDKVYSLYQNNRNPFVDHPEWVASIFGGAPPPSGPPVITSQPQNRTVNAGDNATFTVGAAGATPLSYQWRFNGTDIAGATASVYIVVNAQSANAGSYSVLVTNAEGSALSSDAVLTVNAAPPVTIAQWNFNSNPPDANTATGTTTPNAGSGTASLVGGTSGTFVSGSATDPASSGTDNSGWNTASYPAQGTGNKTAGVKFATSTAGYRNIIVRWDHRLSSTASKYCRLQYTINGTDFLDFPTPISMSAASVFESKTNDLSTINGVNDNPNFAVRIVGEFESTAIGNANANYVTVSGSGYGTSGTIRYDMVTISGSAIPVPPPPAPGDLTATAGDAQVSLAWTASAGATSYKVKRAGSTGGPYSVIASSVTATSYNDTTPANGTTYFYVVSAVNSGGESADSNEASATPQAPRPASPTALNATGGNAVVDLTWTQSTSPGITGNNVYRSTSGSGGPYSLYASLSATTSYSDTGVVNGNTYFYHVTAINAGGESDPSAYAGATPSCPLPATPTGLGATAGNNQVALSWNAASGATSYNVKRSTTSGGPYTTITNVTSTSFTDTTAVNGTTYYYVVSAVNSCGEGANSSQVSATPSCPLPATPTGLGATSGNNQVALSWNAASGAASYDVKRSTTSGGPYTTITNVTSTSFTDTTAVNGTTYYYVVSAVNSCGASANSSQVSATPSAPVPAAPSNLTATPGKRKITLNWTDNSNNETGFRIERSTNGVNFTEIGTVGANVTSVVNSGLTSGTLYYYRVRAYNANGNSAYSNVASARPN